MEELKELFGDNLEALITLYKCCPSKLEAVHVEQPQELSEEQKLHLAKFTKTMKSRGKILLICNWRLLADDKTVDYAKVWEDLQEYVDKIPKSVKKQIRRRSIDQKYLECFDEVPANCLGLTPDEIYEKTGKIVHTLLIYTRHNREDSDELEQTIKEVKEKFLNLEKEDRAKFLFTLITELNELDKENEKESECNELVY